MPYVVCRVNLFYWNSLSVDESEKRLTLFQCCLNDSVKMAIKETFDCEGIFAKFRPVRRTEPCSSLHWAKISWMLFQLRCSMWFPILIGLSGAKFFLV